MPRSFCGNLAVFPGSHLRLQDYFRANGFERVKSLGIAGLPSAREAGFDRPPEQVGGRAGDVVIANYNLAHLVAPNASPDIRYCVYFRVRTLAHGTRQGHRPESMLDVWADWPGLLAAREEEEMQLALQASRADVMGNFRGGLGGSAAEGTGVGAADSPAGLVDLTSGGEEDEELKLALAI